MKATWILTGVGVAAVVLVPFVLRGVYSNVDAQPSGTLAYWLGIPDVIKGAPIVSQCESPLYTSRGNDARISYGTEVSRDHMQAVMASYFATEGCTIVETETDDMQLSCENGATVQVTVTEADICRPVIVTVKGGL